MDEDDLYDDEPISLDELVAQLTRSYSLTPDESVLLLRIGEWHDEAMGLLGEALEEAIRRDPTALDLGYVTSQKPLIVEAIRVQALPHRDELGVLVLPPMAEAVVGLCFDHDEGPAAVGLQLLADALEPLVPHQAKVALEYWRGRTADWLGAGLAAEGSFERAVSLDPEWGPALEWLAAMASDRGDAERALSLLDRAGVGPDDGMRKMLQTFLPEAGETLRRNDPCWCGSGRKLKACHRGPAPLPIAQRATWLWHKASAFMHDGPWREELLELAAERSRYGGERELLRALDESLLTSAILFEGFALETFAETRGPLLPADELALLQQWLEARRGLFEVEEVHPGEGLQLRNVLDGERVYVHEKLGSREAHVGMLFVSLALPRGDGSFALFGGVEPVGLHQRAQVIALLDSRPEPFDLVSVMTDRFAPPQFVTKEGDAVEWHVGIIRIKGRASIARRFDEQFTRSGDGEWIVGLDGGAVQPGSSIGGTLTVDGREVALEAMSEERMDMLLDAISRLGFEYELLSDDVVDVSKFAHSETDTAPPATGPEADAVLVEYIAQYERDWLDMDIPALGGLTPRQAAADPVARLDLIALINSFPTGIPNTMDADRLRAALELD